MRAGCLGVLVISGYAIVAASHSYAVCGDGVVEAGEDCDAGQSQHGSCCTATCNIAAAGTVCREQAGLCDVVEICDGLSSGCPTNRFRPAEICRPAVGDCDVAEYCTGVGPACPADRFHTTNVVCRAATGPCDSAEQCSGLAPDCPPDPGEIDTDLDGICDPLDGCPLVTDPEQTDADSDGLGDACDPCSLVASVTVDRARLRLSKLSAAGNNRLRLVTMLTVPGLGLLDPSEAGLRLLLRGPLGTVFDVEVPGNGASGSEGLGWQSVAPGRWLYRDPEAGMGVRKVSLRQDPVLTWRVYLAVVGRDGDFRSAIGQSELTLTIVMDPPVARNGHCAELTFQLGGPQSSCRLLNSGSRLQCRWS